ncbi:sensor histidine kinase [Evansella cellulosilytica]|uniref:histidine kinase n=1 Tax=Evansella cellulosilytica (strain ATCC 21833 / DSM 2522 / FERM P-1141 / JCM 9156 / N-4) TaxID=649639 RepID=E6TWJ1_EVAC2|nr:sensor histidine kinase [Evansella cellulosilytica]ADU32254.1 integral membrane sensor signal transduction histidine kinase [Evansella cellulosilytica DSM 2522]
MENMYLNVLVIIVFILAYHVFVNVHHVFKRYSQFTLIILSIISITLCMNFPIYESHGHVFDLRFIPILIGAIYGGKKVVLVLIIYSIITRFFIGGHGFYVYLITSLSFGALLIYGFIPLFNRLTQNKKIVYSSLVALAYISYEFTICHIWFGTLTKMSPILMIISILVAPLLTAGVVYLIEYLRNANELMENYNIHNKTKALSEMASSISHEIRNPLTVTKGFIQLVQNDDTIEVATRKSHLKLALQELERAESIITDYLTYAKPYDEINLQKIDVKKEVEYIINVINPLALMNNVKVSTSFDDHESYFIKIDKKKLHQILLNLSKNAIEAMPNGGVLHIFISKEKNKVMIEMKDSGVGMTKEEVSRLGTPFLSTKAKGTGLGTMVVFRLVKTLNGQISVSSKKGEGTSFKLRFNEVN